MKLRYKQRLFLYFFIIFALFTIGVVIFEQSRERKHKTEALKEKLDAYASMVDASLRHNHNQLQAVDSLLLLFPSNLRLSVIDRKGNVLFDNAISDLSSLENHLDRPEIQAALTNEAGEHIRKSTSNKHEYLYYAKRFSSYFIRVALPYDIQVRHFLKADNLFLYFIAGLFILSLLLISYVSGRFGKSIKQLRDFTINAESGTASAIAVSFPDDELGEIGTKIADSYQQLEAQKKTLALEREKLLQHVQSSDEGLCFFSANRVPEFYNGLFIQYLNTIVDSANSNPSAIFSDALFSDLNEFLASGERYYEAQASKQGKTFTVRANVFDDGSFELVINDITKQEKTRQLKQEMTGNIAHELRTPVTSIRGYLETVLEQQLEPEKERDFLAKAYSQVITLSSLIQDMGLITKIEESPQLFQLEPVSISKLVNGLKDDLEAQLSEKNIKVECSVSENVVVKGNSSLLYSVFRNLTDNSIRYAGSNITIAIDKATEDKDFYYFSFADNGVGVDEKHLNRLFERFYRISEGRTRDSGGSGLGLSIVKNAILFHKGTITAKNRPEGGLEFLFKLPKYA